MRIVQVTIARVYNWDVHQRRLRQAATVTTSESWDCGAAPDSSLEYASMPSFFSFGALISVYQGEQYTVMNLRVDNFCVYLKNYFRSPVLCLKVVTLSKHMIAYLYLCCCNISILHFFSDWFVFLFLRPSFLSFNAIIVLCPGRPLSSGIFFNVKLGST